MPAVCELLCVDMFYILSKVIIDFLPSSSWWLNLTLSSSSFIPCSALEQLFALDPRECQNISAYPHNFLLLLCFQFNNSFLVRRIEVRWEVWEWLAWMCCLLPLVVFIHLWGSHLALEMKRDLKKQNKTLNPLANWIGIETPLHFIYNSLCLKEVKMIETILANIVKPSLY